MKPPSFSGFPAGKVRFTRIPGPFFSELLPLIDDLAKFENAATRNMNFSGF